LLKDLNVQWFCKNFRSVIGDRRFAVEALRLGSHHDIGRTLYAELLTKKKEIMGLFKQYKPKLVVVFGAELAKILKPALLTRSDKNVAGYVHRLEFGPKPPMICIPHLLDDQHVARNLDEFICTFIKVPFMLENPNADKEGEIIDLSTDESAKKYLEFLANEYDGYIAYDTETRNLNKRYNNRLACMQFATDTNKGYVLYWNHDYNKRSREHDEKVLKPLLKKIFSGRSKIKGLYAHNAQFDISSTRFGLEIDYWGIQTFDTILILSHLDQNRRRNDRLIQPLAGNSAGELKQLVNEFFGYDGYEAEAKAARKDGSLIDLPYDRLTKYAGQDGFVEFRLAKFLLYWAKILGRRDDIMRFSKYIHSRALRTFQDMSYEGMLIDMKHVNALEHPQSAVSKELDRVRALFKNDPVTISVNKALLKKRTNASNFWMIPWIFDIAKPMSKMMLFFDKKVGLGLEPLKDPKDKKAEPKASCDEHFQTTYKAIPQVKWLTEFSEIEKLRNTYISKMSIAIRTAKKNKTDLVDGCVHPIYNLNGTDTGRLSCVKPNLQQIPRADNDFKKAVKSVFITEIGTCILQADFAAAEVRMWGSLSKDRFLCELLTNSFNKRAAYRANPTDIKLRDEAEIMADVHKQTASLMFGVSIESVDKALRTITKGITFGLIYGRGTRSIAEQLGKSEEETQALCNKFFAQFPDGVAWLDEMKQFVQRHRYIETPFKRRRYLPWVKDKDQGLVALALRQAINSPVQSASGDFATLSISLLHEELHRTKMDKHIKLINAVHDSTLVKCPQDVDTIAEISAMIRDCFTVKSKAIAEDVFGFEMPAPMDIDMEISQRKAWKCTKCGNVYKAYKSKCDKTILGEDKKPLKDEHDKDLKCNHTGRTEIKLNGGWGTLIGLDETMSGYREAAMGF
jgi:DNA polymerase I-like protein with 3'-5' exonuclease and polymerase domains